VGGIDRRRRGAHVHANIRAVDGDRGGARGVVGGVGVVGGGDRRRVREVRAGRGAGGGGHVHPPHVAGGGRPGGGGEEVARADRAITGVGTGRRPGEPRRQLVGEDDVGGRRGAVAGHHQVELRLIARVDGGRGCVQGDTRIGAVVDGGLVADVAHALGEGAVEAVGVGAWGPWRRDGIARAGGRVAGTIFRHVTLTGARPADGARGFEGI